MARKRANNRETLYFAAIVYRTDNGGRGEVRMLVSTSLQRFFSSSPPLALFQIFTFRAVLTFYSSFLSCCFITFKDSLFRHESTHVAFARIRDGLFASSLYLYPLFPRFHLSAAFFFFFSNIRDFRSFHISRFFFHRSYTLYKYAACFTGTLINNASSTEIVGGGEGD